MTRDQKLDEFIKTTLKFKELSELKEFMKGILTPLELEEIPTRLQIVKMLKKNVPHHEIAKKLNVGVATVTRGSKEIQKGRFKTIE